MGVNLVSDTNGLKKTGYPGKPITEIITNEFFTVDQRWIVKYWNKAAERLLGVRVADIIGKNLWEEFAGAIPVDFYTFYHNAFIQDVPAHFEEYNHPAHSRHPERQLKTRNELYRFVTEVTNDCLWSGTFRPGRFSG